MRNVLQQRMLPNSLLDGFGILRHNYCMHNAMRQIKHACASLQSVYTKCKNLLAYNSPHVLAFRLMTSQYETPSPGLGSRIRHLTNVYVGAATLALTLGGCVRYNLDQPLVFAPDDSYAGVRSDIQEVIMNGFSAAAKQLHGSIASTSPNPSITLIFRDYYSENDGEAFDKTIVFYLSVNEEGPLLPQILAMHELGHVLGAHHIPCDESRSIMCVDWFRTKDATYTSADIAEICRTASGGVCTP